jgi:hypothetical protein
MREIEEKPIREQYARELTELVDRQQAWTPAEAIDEQIEREARELQPLLEAVRDLAQSRSFHEYVWNRWSSAGPRDQSALQPILDKATEAKTTASGEVDRLKAEHDEAVQRLFVLFRLRGELDHREPFS